MNEKLKVLGLGLLAGVAISAMAAIGASANVTGHFTHDGSGGHALITGTESGDHKTKMSIDGGTPIECEEATSHGTVGEATVTTLRVTPTYTGCHTEGGAAGSVVIDSNECHLVYHSNTKASSHTPTTHATATLECTGKSLVITHPNCEIRVPSQTSKGVTYTTDVGQNKHQITLNKTAVLSVQYHGGICIFLGTSHQMTLVGSTTLVAHGTSGEQVNLTAT